MCACVSMCCYALCVQLLCWRDVGRQLLAATVVVLQTIMLQQINTPPTGQSLHIVGCTAAAATP